MRLGSFAAHRDWVLWGRGTPHSGENAGAKKAAPAAAPTSVPQSQNERMFLKYKGEPLSADEIGKSTRPAPIGGPSKF
jgi:hypothetical protein